MYTKSVWGGGILKTELNFLKLICAATLLYDCVMPSDNCSKVIIYFVKNFGIALVTKFIS